MWTATIFICWMKINACAGGITPKQYATEIQCIKEGDKLRDEFVRSYISRWIEVYETHPPPMVTVFSCHSRGTIKA